MKKLIIKLLEKLLERLNPEPEPLPPPNDIEKRPNVLDGTTRTYETPCGGIFVTINRHPVKNNIVEVIARGAKNGTCTFCFQDTLGRLITKFVKRGTSPESLIKILKGSNCAANNDTSFSCPHAIGLAIEKELSHDNK